MKPSHVLLFSTTFAMSLVPLCGRAGQVKGTTAGSTVTAPPLTLHPLNRDDYDTASTINVSYTSYCPWIVAGATAFPTYNFVFAGQPGVGSNFTPIVSSDFTISQYKPWVVDNNATTNNITGPDSGNYNRKVTGLDAGGADIVVSYTPLNNGDPTSVNFVQAFIQNTNNTGFTTGTIDYGGGPTPYYNGVGVSGTGTTKQTGTTPFTTNSTTPAWMVDIPFRREDGRNPPFTDDTIISQVQTFQTFIESDQVFDGKTYQVLYGGVQWGYTFITADVPEPGAYALLVSLSVAGTTFLRRRRAR